MLPLIVAVLALGVLGLAVYKMMKNTSVEAPPQVVHMAAPARGVNRMQAGLRRRAGRRAAAAAEDEEDEEDEAAGGRREEQQQERRPTKKDAYEARRAARDAEREAAEAAQEEEFRRAAEERQRREEEEAAKWMHTFTVEAAGEEADTAEDAEALLDSLVEYIKARKAVALDELAAEFRLRTQEVIAKVQALEEAGRLTGVMDDRGKFIYISMQEMEAARDYIRARGRIAIAELAASSEQFIDLSAREVPARARGGEVEVAG